MFNNHNNIMKTIIICGNLRLLNLSKNGALFNKPLATGLRVCGYVT